MSTQTDSSPRATRKGRAPIDPVVLRAIALLALTVFIDLLGFGIVMPNIPQYVEAAVGHNHQHAAFIGGLLAASYSLPQFICAPLWGTYSDRKGRRPVILFSLIGVAISYMFFGFSHGHLWMLFAARILAGFLSSASIGVAFAYAADVTTPENRATGVGILGACLGLGFTLGPMVGGLLGSVNINLPAFVAAGMALTNFVLSWFILPESLTAEKRAELASAHRPSYPFLIRQVLADPAAPLFLVTFIMTLGFTAIEQAFGYFLMARGLATPANQQQRQAYLLGFVGLMGIILQGGFIGRLTKKYGEGMLIRTGLVLLAAGYVALLVPRSWGVLIFLATALVGCGRSMIGPATTTLISRKTRVGQGLIQSSSQGFDALARTAGPLIAGTLFTAFGSAAPYAVSSVLTLLALGITFALSGALIINSQDLAYEAAR